MQGQVDRQIHTHIAENLHEFFALEFITKEHREGPQLEPFFTAG